MLRDTIIKQATDSGLVWKGPWSDGTCYVVNDLVENNGNVYIAIADHCAALNNEPGVGVDWTLYWDLFIEGTAGTSGTSGSSGSSGTSGSSGSSGSSGTSGTTPNIYVDSTSGDVYFYDNTRSKNLGVAIIQQDVGRNHPAVTDQFLRGEGDTPTNLNGFVLPWNATLISISMSGDLNTQTWSAEVRKNGGGIAQDTLTITNQYSNYSDNNNVDFNAGDRIMVYCSGTAINYPHVTLFFRRRF
jgi:hypothetical protein